jgi:C4-dicarboxylate-specific signal transduction histidine kinase
MPKPDILRTSPVHSNANADGPAPAPAGHTPLHLARAQNEAAQGTLEKSAAELELINTVLKQELPAHVQSDDVALALEKSNELELQIHDTAQDLAEVNKALHQEISERAALEKELTHAKAALEEARKDTQAD